MHKVYLGHHSALSPSGMLDEAVNDYLRGHIPLQNMKFQTERITIDACVGIFAKRYMDELQDPFKSDLQMRLKKALASVIADFSNKITRNDFDALFVGRGRLRTVHFDEQGASLKYTWPVPIMLDWINESLRSKGIWVPRNRTVCLETTCATGVSALKLGFDRISNGKAKRILLLTFDPTTLISTLVMNALGVLTRHPRPLVFHQSRDGFARSEAVSLVALSDQPETDQAPVIVKSVSLSSDASGLTEIDSEGKGITTCLTACLRAAEISSPSFIKAHGTGTKMNDRIEATTLGKLFADRKNKIPMISLKSQFGHTLNGSGLFELLMANSILQLNKLMPVINSSGSLDHLPVFVPQTSIENMNLKSCVGLAMGFGGINAAYCLEKIS